MEKLRKLEPDERRNLKGGLFSGANEIWNNDIYCVGLWRSKAENGEVVIRISIKGVRDEKPIEPSWCDKQEIKNDLVGAEFVGVELYPAESDRNDQANQYHLWIMENRLFRFPFGWKGRATSQAEGKGELVE